MKKTQDQVHLLNSRQEHLQAAKPTPHALLELFNERQVFRLPLTHLARVADHPRDIRELDRYLEQRDVRSNVY